MRIKAKVTYTIKPQIQADNSSTLKKLEALTREFEQEVQETVLKPLAAQKPAETAVPKHAPLVASVITPETKKVLEAPAVPPPTKGGLTPVQMAEEVIEIDQLKKAQTAKLAAIPEQSYSSPTYDAVAHAMHDYEQQLLTYAELVEMLRSKGFEAFMPGPADCTLAQQQQVHFVEPTSGMMASSGDPSSVFRKVKGSISLT